MAEETNGQNAQFTPPNRRYVHHTYLAFIKKLNVRHLHEIKPHDPERESDDSGKL